MALVSLIHEILQRPTIGGVLSELVALMTPVWIAVVVGVLVGWAWKPKWANLVTEFSDSSKDSFSINVGSFPCLSSLKLQLPSCILWNSVDGDSQENTVDDSSKSEHMNETSGLVKDDDLRHLSQLVEETDGGPAWIKMMDKATRTMAYQAWRRDPENEPPEYRSSTIFEDATPEMVRDFFWDDEFRAKWDDMLIHAETLAECPSTGNMMVQWVRKFPFFCSDREYIIGRRIWESGRSYYCITKGVPCTSIPRRNKPLRVDFYYSSWCIRAVESKRDNGQLTACEVLLFHHEDMGIPREIAKLGIRQGMWGAVKKIEPGLRLYQKERAAGAAISRCAFMAQINSKASPDYLRSLEAASKDDESSSSALENAEKQSGRCIPKLVVVGGAIALACTLDRGLLTKALIFGVARRVAKIGRT